MRQETQRRETLVRQFENNNSEYVKIQKCVDEKIHAMLSDAKQFIYLALYCLIDSIKKNPYIYSPLISENMPISQSQYAHGYRLHSHDGLTYFDLKVMLEEEAANMYEVLSKGLAAEILNSCTDSQSSQPSLPLFPSNIEQKGT